MKYNNIFLSLLLTLSLSACNESSGNIKNIMSQYSVAEHNAMDDYFDPFIEADLTYDKDGLIYIGGDFQLDEY